MKRNSVLVPLIALALVVIWLVGNDKVDVAALKNAVGIRSTAPATSVTSKPVCSQIIVPAGTDCIPQHLANLPPDPGAAGLATIEGIDADKDGVRDDVQRFIALNFGDSPRSVAILRNIAKSKQLAVIKGDSISREEAQKLAPIAFNAGACYVLAADQQTQNRRALELVSIEVTNTPERYKRAQKFMYQAGHTSYVINELSAAEACGFDPAALPN